MSKSVFDLYIINEIYILELITYFANTISTISFPINVHAKSSFSMHIYLHTHIHQKEIFQRFHGRGTISAHSDK